MDTIKAFANSLNLPPILLVVIIAFVAHAGATLVSRLSILASARLDKRSLAKIRTVITLTAGMLVFAVYFLAAGAILAEFGISLTAYLATASVIGLAVGFGSQGVVQDVVTGLTVILSDLVEVNDMVEISGQTGIVMRIGMRFTVLRNAMGAIVYIPNRTLTNLINYPKGYVRCLMDINLSADTELADKMEAALPELLAGFREQFPGILRDAIEVEHRAVTAAGKQFIRIKFRIWPGRGGPIETTLKQDICAAMLGIDEKFRDNQVAINYEVADPVLVKA